MCELLALAFDRPVCPDFVLRAFGQRSDGNPDGWGLAWYPDQSVALVKEPVKWTSSRLATFFEVNSRLRASLILAHVREMSHGQAIHANTHPFCREHAGRAWVCAHNGTLDVAFRQLPLGRFIPIGQTDSEYLFCHLLEEIAQRPDLLDTPASWTWLGQRLQELNALGRINLLLSDGQRLFCYHDLHGAKGLQRCRLERDNIPGWVIATCPLFPGPEWESFRWGELTVFEHGVLRWTNGLRQRTSPASDRFAVVQGNQT